MAVEGHDLLPETAEEMDGIIALSDDNFDGLFEQDEFVDTLQFCAKAIESRKKREKRWTVVKTGFTQRDARVFNAHSLLECIMKIGFAYLNFHGTDAQAILPSWQKALWTVSYLEKRFEKKVRDTRK